MYNQRIERLCLWRDAYSGCISLFYDTFYAPEDASLLDPSNEIEMDLFCLHFVYLPRIQHQLDIFRDILIAIISCALKTTRVPISCGLEG